MTLSTETTAVVRRPAGVLLPRAEKVTVTLTLSADKVDKLHAFMAADTWEKAEAARKADLEGCMDSLEHAVRFATTHVGTSGGRVFATFLASLYNGNRVKADVSDIGLLDGGNFEHLLNILRLCYETHREPHDFFKNGNDLFERIIKDWGLEKRRRRS